MFGFPMWATALGVLGAGAVGGYFLVRGVLSRWRQAENDKARADAADGWQKGSRDAREIEEQADAAAKGVIDEFKTGKPPPITKW